jgi:tetratricopeptide (TPR) repeat protein
MIIRFLPILLLLAAPLRAENTDLLPARTQELERAKETQVEADKAAAEARKREVFISTAGADVTYEAVLADPDNVSLNYRYARAQVKKGNLRGAISTLERILMIKPEATQARLLYAIVLMRAGDLGEAEREFQTLQSKEVPYELRAELNRRLREIRRLTQKTRLSGVFGAGMDYSDNQNSAPASGQRLFQDVPITLDSASTRRGDSSRVMLANVGLAHDFAKGGHQLAGSVGYYRAEQDTQKELNLQNYSAGLTGLYKTPWVDLSPSYDFNHLLLAQTTYLRSHTVGLRLSREFGRAAVFAETAYADQRYNRTEVAPAGDQRTGNMYQGGAGGSLILGSRNRLTLSYSHVEQGAAERFDAYRRETVALEDACILGLGQFLLFSVSGNFDRYLAPESAISANYRHDQSLRGRATYGLPLGFIARPLDDAMLNFTYEYYQTFSNLTNYSYTNNKVSTLLTYKWSVGL